MTKKTYSPRVMARLSITFESEAGINPTVVTAIPITMTINKTNYRAPDTFSMTFYDKELPFTDPALIRNVGVQIFITDGVEITKEYMDEGKNVTFSGVAMDVQENSGNSGIYFTVQGTDYTGLLTRNIYPPIGKRSTSNPYGLDLNPVKRTHSGTVRQILTNKKKNAFDVIKEVFDLYNAASKMTTGGSSTDLELVIDKGIDRSTIPTVTSVVQSSDTDPEGTGIRVLETSSYWDVAFGIAQRYGFVITSDGISFCLRRPQTFERSTNRIRMEWSKNVIKSSLQRSYVRGTSERVLIISETRANKAKGIKRRVIKEFYPPKSSQDEEDVITYEVVPFFGEPDRDVMIARAKARYESRIRRRRSATILTRDMSDLNGESLIDINNTWWLFAPPSTGGNKTLSTEESDRVSRLQGPLRIDSARIVWDVSSGISFELNAVAGVIKEESDA